MKDLQFGQKCKKSYQTVDSDKREQILIMLREQHIKPSIVTKLNHMQVSRNLGIKVSTIKAIHRIFKKEGRKRKKEKRDKKVITRQQYTIILTDGKSLQLLASNSEEFINIVPFTEEIGNDKVLAKLKAELIQKKEVILREIEESEAQKQIKKDIRRFKDINWLDIIIPQASNKIAAIQLAKLLKSNIEKKVEPQTLINLQTLAPLSMKEQIQIQMDVVQQQIMMMVKK